MIFFFGLGKTSEGFLKARKESLDFKGSSRCNRNLVSGGFQVPKSVHFVIHEFWHPQGSKNGTSADTKVHLYSFIHSLIHNKVYC